MARSSLAILFVLLISAPLQAQEGIGASVRVVNPQAVFSLAGTDGVRALSENSVFAITTGDAVQTDRRGRALLTFADSLELLLLPESRLTVLANERLRDGTYALRLRIDGHSVQRLHTSESTRLLLTIETERGTARARRGWFALWSSLERATVITVAEGSVDFLPIWGQPLYTADAARGMVVGLSSAEIIPISPPYNGARMIGLSSTCEGVVRAQEGVLNIRAGTSLGYAVIGDLRLGARVRIMGVTEDRVWYRVQRFSGFGWTLTSGIEADCPNLTIYPNLSGEANRELFDVEPVELELLAPFYGQLEDDLWFYRWPEPPGT